MMLLTLFESSNYLQLVGLLIVLYVCHFYYSYFTRHNPLPGPFPLPLIGNILELGDLGMALMKWKKKYGDIYEIYLGKERSIVLNNGNLIEKIFSQSAKTNYLHRLEINEGLREIGVGSKGIFFNGDFESWRFNRKFLSQSITSARLLEGFVVQTQTLCEELETYWARLGYGTELDFTKWAPRFTSDIILNLATGKPSYSLATYYNVLAPKGQELVLPESVLKESEEFITRILNWSNTITFFNAIPAIVRHYVPGIRSYNDRLIREMDRLHEIVGAIVDKRRAEIDATPLDEELPADLLTILIITNTARDPNRISSGEYSRPLTNEDIRFTLLEMCIGGIDTSATSYSLITYYMCQNPEVKKRLIEEIDTVIGGDFKTRMTCKKLDELVYLDAIIKEASRMLPVTPMMTRYAEDDDEVAGYQWKKGTLFWANFYGIHQNSKHWENPEKFDPTRFLKTEDGAPKIDKMAHMQWGGGLRVCPGKNIAIYELKVLIAELFGKYDVQLSNPSKPLQFSCNGLTRCKELGVILTPRTF